MTTTFNKTGQRVLVVNDKASINDPISQGPSFASCQWGSKDGNGLGFRIVDVIMCAHSREVTVVSELGKGAALTLHLEV